MINSTRCLYRCTLVLAFEALKLLNLVTCMLAHLAWSFMPLRYPDLWNLNSSILSLSQYSILLSFMTSSLVFLLETGIFANLFMLVLI